MLIPLAVMILSCGAHHPVSQEAEEVVAETECEAGEVALKKKLLPEEEEQEEAQEEEARHIVTFSESESSED